MLAANFLDYLPQPDDTRYFQAVAPSSHQLAHGGRLFSPLKLHFIGNLSARWFLFDALFDNGDFLAREAVRRIDDPVEVVKRLPPLAQLRKRDLDRFISTIRQISKRGSDSLLDKITSRFFGLIRGTG